jgi:hypothetical protein
MLNNSPIAPWLSGREVDAPEVDAPIKKLSTLQFHEFFM